jgi:CubicO group peptidase (beta-lactamase class C family)
MPRIIPTSKSPALEEAMDTRTAVHGVVSPGFEAVRDTFRENFDRRNELGGGVCAYYKGQKVVDLWGGVRNKVTGEPWQDDTMVLVYSATKGLAAMTLAIAHSRGWLDYDERVAAYWPEFAQGGKLNVTVRQLLGHEAGLPVVDERLDPRILEDFDRLAAAIAKQRPAWPPGERHGYHGVSLGWYEGELMRRVDPEGRTLGRFFAEEIAAPLGLEVYFGAPDDFPRERLARIERVPAWKALPKMRDLPRPMALAMANPRSLSFRTFANPRLRRRRDRRSARHRPRVRRDRGGPAGARHHGRDHGGDHPFPKGARTRLARPGAEGGHSLLARLRPPARRVPLRLERPLLRPSRSGRLVRVRRP